jgi:hypothetical protein
MEAGIMIQGEDRRGFLKTLGGLSVAIAPMILAAGVLRAQQAQDASPAGNLGSKPDEDSARVPASARKAALEENEKDIKKKVERLFQLATELKNETDKTNSVNVLSVAMLKKADEIERLARDIKSRAKG